MSDVLEYDKTIIESIHHIEEILVKFALQNYAAAGAVILAYYTADVPIKAAGPAVIVLGLVFTWRYGERRPEIRATLEDASNCPE